MTPSRLSVPSVQASERLRQTWLLSIFWCLALGLGALQALDAHEIFMDPDGICYLDISDAWLRGDWRGAINSLWPPLYPGLLSVARLVLHPSPRWEFPAVRLVNFIIYLFTLGCFQYFLSEWIQYQRHRQETLIHTIVLPTWAWLVIGYVLFIWSSLKLITILEDSPDMLVAAFVYLLAGILLRHCRGLYNRTTFILFGVILGLSYLAKAYMFLMAFVFIAVAVFAVINSKMAIRYGLIAFTVFFALGSLYIIPLYLTKGRWMFSDSGTLNYLFHIDGMPNLHWQGDASGHGVPTHPTRQLWSTPPIYEFGTPIGGTYPPWYDPAYWNDGARPAFNLGGHLRVLTESASTYYKIFFVSGGELLVGFLTLYFMSHRGRWGIKDIAAQWVLLIPALAALALQGVVHVEPRYTGPFVVLLWLSLFSAVRLPASQESRRLITGTVVAILVVMLGTSGFPLARQAYVIPRLLNGVYRPWGYEQWQVADGLHQLGIAPGDRVAFLGNGMNNSWARLARVRIVAEMRPPEEDHFWEANDEVKQHLIRIFATTGARAIVTAHMPIAAANPDWHQVGTTAYYAYLLP